MDSRVIAARVGRGLARPGLALWRRLPAIARGTPGFLGRWLLRLALPVGGAATMLHLFPYYTTAAGLHLRIQGTIVTTPGLSADTTIGNWQFPHVDGLPIGVHVTPENVDLLRLSAQANANSQGFTDQLRNDLSAQVPAILAWLAGETLIGILLGLLIAAGANLAGRYLRGQVREPNRGRAELRHRGRQLGAALAVVVLVVGYGALTYNPRWSKQSKLTGTLGAVQLVPDQLAQFYNHQSKAFDVISAISGIQAELQKQIGSPSVAGTTFNIMFISDMHLASTYPLVRQYASNFNVKLIVNTGDETEFGTSYDLSDEYLSQIRDLTSTIPMIWLAGNHDSPATVETMRAIPGVTVLGTKAFKNGGYQVGAQYVSADGLVIAGVPDPRVYGAAGVYGSDKDSETDPLEKSAVDRAVKGVPKTMNFDIFGTHEPVAAHELLKELPGRIRQVNSGHTHAQNSSGQVQPGSTIDLVEGSTGAGGLDAIGSNAPPVEFSIESVASTCQFTQVVRFQLGGASGSGSSGSSASDYGQNVTAATIYLKPQTVDPARYCSAVEGISAVQDLLPTTR
jgi:predicted MPP superfamily phosphohydrolase